MPLSHLSPDLSSFDRGVQRNHARSSKLTLPPPSEAKTVHPGPPGVTLPVRAEPKGSEVVSQVRHATEKEACGPAPSGGRRSRRHPSLPPESVGRNGLRPERFILAEGRVLACPCLAVDLVADNHIDLDDFVEVTALLTVP